MVIKNIWSLNVDEAIVAEKIKKELGKKHEVFFPINSQLKDIDLLIQNPKTGKSKAIQVKGSRTWNLKGSRRKKLGWGDVSSSWLTIKERSIFSTTNKIDFFIFTHIEHVLHPENMFCDYKTKICGKMHHFAKF